MLAATLSTLRGLLASSLIVISLMTFFFPGFLPVALAKLLVPHSGFRRSCTRCMLFFARLWLATVEWITDYVSGQRIVIEDSVPPDPTGRYLLIGNHQSWADILVLIRALRGTLPFPRWFIKQQMIWIPIIGFATWALDFPYMKRYSKEEIEQNPSLAGKDLETTRQACEIYRYQSVTVVNYAEGTRSTAAKRAARESPYMTMLRPKAGGTAFMLEAMGDVLDGTVELIIAYRGVGAPNFWDFLCGRIPEMRARLRPLEIPPDLRRGDYQNDSEYARRFRDWLNGVWAERDTEVAALSDRGNRATDAS